MDTMKQKITKLLEKANSTTFEAEAEMLLAKARSLMEEHQISMFELGEDPFETRQSGEFQKETQAQLRYDLQASLAEYLDMKVAILTFDRRPGERLPQAVYEFVGTQSSQITLEFLFPFVWGQILRLVKEAVRVGITDLQMSLSHQACIREDWPSIERRTHRKLLKDTTRAMQVRLDQLIEDRKGKPQEDTAAANALVKIGGELEAFYQERYPNLGPGKERVVAPTAAACYLANQVRLDTQVEAQEDPTRLLK